MGSEMIRLHRVNIAILCTILPTPILASEIGCDRTLLMQYEGQLEAMSWSNCVKEFNKSVSKDLCGSGGCFPKDGQTLESECGTEPTAHRKIRIREGELRTACMWEDFEKEQAKKDSIKLRIGMPEQDILTKYGKPSQTVKTVSIKGEMKQLTYRAEGMIFYLVDGYLTAWQEL